MKPMHADKPHDKAFDLFTKVVGFPARVQGMMLNALLNTIDKAQTDAILKESAAELERRKHSEKKD
jgi:hypothetical protein